MRRLGLDIGEARIGISISDEEGKFAFPLTTLERKSKDKDIAAIRELASSRKVGEMVVGLPLNMNGKPGPQAEQILAFVEEIKKSLPQPVKVWDERLSTLQVEKELIGYGVSRAKRRRNIDKLAAQVILQSYLDSVDAGLKNV